jgi:hypothetical protein
VGGAGRGYGIAAENLIVMLLEKRERSPGLAVVQSRVSFHGRRNMLLRHRKKDNLQQANWNVSSFTFNDTII